VSGTRLSLNLSPTTAQRLLAPLGEQSPTQAALPIAGATATITHLATNRETAATTDREGKYTPPALLPVNTGFRSPSLPSEGRSAIH
jgi:hypothetical protein